MISTTFEYSRATSLDDALARLRAANGGGKLVAGGHSLIPLMGVLVGKLLRLRTRGRSRFLIVARAHPHRFVQFDAGQSPGALRGEAISNHFSTRPLVAQPRPVGVLHAGRRSTSPSARCR